jgi:PTH1 family peptidyl-tRNA hydrolase
MADAEAWLVVGLGNPGPRYAANRHNVGSLVVDVLADRVGGRFRRHKSGADVIEARLAGQRVVLAKARSYMNDSGAPVAGVRRFFGVSPQRLVIVHDDLDLDFGRLRVKYGGGDGGHNGLRSVRRSLSTGDWSRVRFGVGRAPGRMDPADYVLRDFSAAERRDLGVHLEQAADAVEMLIASGLQRTQNAFNAEPPA